MHGDGTLAVRCAEAVGACVATAEDDDALARRAELRVHAITGVHLVLLRQELHREVDALQVAARHREITRLRRAAGEDDRVELAPELVALHVDADVDGGPEGHALGRHLLHAAVDEPLLHLEVRDAVAEEAADPVGTLEQHDVVAGAAELLRARHPGGTGADDRDALATPPARRRRCDETRVPRVVDDVLLDVLDRDRVVVDVEDARLLARGGADAAGELGEVVRRVQPIDRLAPAPAVHEVVPVGDDVPERAALVTEGDATIHAARALALQHLVGRALLELAPVLQAVGDRLLVDLLALELEEPGDLTHASCPWLNRGESRGVGVEVLLREDIAILDGHHLDEVLHGVAPAGEEAPRDGRVRVVEVALDEVAHGLPVVLAERLELDHALVEMALERAVLVEHVRDAARHAGREVAARLAEHDDEPFRHVLAAVVADALDDRGDAGIADAEALARESAQEDLAAGRAVEGDVPDDDVLLGHEGRTLRGVDDDAPAGEALRKVVVRVALDLDGHAVREPRAEALPGGARELDADRVRRQAVCAPAPGDLGGEHRTRRPVPVRDREGELDRLAPLEGRPGEFDDAVVECLLEPVVLRLHAAARDTGVDLGRREDLFQIYAARLPVARDVAHVEHVDAPHHLVERAEPEIGHDLAQLLGDEEHEVDDVLGLPLELLPQHRVLRRDANRAGVEMADAHHDAARRDERRRREAVLLGAEERRNRDVAPGLQLSVGLDSDAAAEVVGDQHLLRLGEAELPWDAGVLDRGER